MAVMDVRYETDMPTVKQTGQPIHIVIPEDLMTGIEDFRYQNRIPSRAETIKALVRLGLAARTGSSPVPGKRGKPVAK